MNVWIVVNATIIVGAIIGFLVLAYFVSNNKLKPPIQQAGTHMVRGASALVIAFLAAGGFAAMYDAADRRGWFVHERKVSVWVGNNWLVGEFKPCTLSENTKAPLMYCVNSDSENVHETLHEMNVEFRGSMDALEHRKPSDWVCQRKESLIACETDRSRNERK